MPRVPQISDSTTQKILRSLDKMCDYVDDGMSCNDAAVKVAVDNGLARGQIELMCQGYNAAAINAQRDEGQTFGEKFAAVAHADAGTVNDRVFASAPVPSVTSKVSRVSAVYSEGTKTKAASASPKTLTPNLFSSVTKESERSGYFGVEDTQYAKAAAMREEIRGLKEATYRASREAAIKTAAVEDAIRTEYREPAKALPWLRKIAGEHFGKIGETIIDKAASNLLDDRDFRKLADHDPELTLGHQPGRLDLNKGVPAAIKVAANAINDWATKEFELPLQVLNIRRDSYNQFGHGKLAADIKLAPPGMTSSEYSDQRWEKVASVFSGAIGGVASKFMGGGSAKQEPSPELVSARLSLNDPNHDAELRAIRAEAMLNDLINNDDVVASYDPQEVASAFMEISQSAPNVIDNMALLRANLRRNLQGNLTTSEAKELAGLRSPTVSPGYQASGPVSPSPKPALSTGQR